MKNMIIKILLAVLNSRFLNGSPCKYGFIGNLDAFSYSHLQSEEQQRPGITVKTILDEADMFRSCPMRKSGLTVIEDGQSREGTIWDVHELQKQFTRASGFCSVCGGGNTYETVGPDKKSCTCPRRKILATPVELRTKEPDI
jgi:hypothetical protein